MVEKAIQNALEALKQKNEEERQQLNQSVYSEDVLSEANQKDK